MSKRQTVSMEDYLEAILLVKREDGVVRVSRIGERLGVKKPSVSYALKKLVERGLVDHESYGYVDITPVGEKIARETYRRHELLVTLLTEIMGVELETAAVDACSMEHYLSPETTEKLSSLVEFILSGPRSDDWLENLKYFQEHGERPPGCPGKHCMDQRG